MKKHGKLIKIIRCITFCCKIAFERQLLSAVQKFATTYQLSLKVFAPYLIVATCTVQTLVGRCAEFATVST